MQVLPGAEAYRAEGGAAAVLLCHGFTGSPQGLRPWAEGLAAAGLTVRLPRLPGHGTTWQDMATTSWADWLGALAAELADLRATGATTMVGGLSMGGALALRLAVDHPGDVAGLVLVNPAVRLPGVRLRLVPVLALGARWRPTVPGVAGDIAKEGVVETAYDRIPLRALASSLAGYRAVSRELGRVRAPLVLLRSAHDAVVPASSSAHVLARVASVDIRAEVLPRSAHVATLDHDADRITAVTLDLVARVAA